jgi:plastocyanin
MRPVLWARVLGALTGAAMFSAAHAEGNLAAQPTDLEPLALDASLNFSVKEYQIETGKYYRWEISSDGGEEFLVKAPELWRNAWINQVVINDIEVKPLGGIEGVEFDDEGSAVIWFIVLRPGEYDYYAAGFEERGMAGKFVVK